MCSMYYHICECGAEYKCFQSDSECREFQGFSQICGACEQWMDEVREDELRREEQRRWDDQSDWEQDYDGNY